METRSNRLPTGDSGNDLTKDERDQNLSSKQHQKFPTGLGISSPPQSKQHGRQELYEVDSPADERHRRRNDLLLRTKDGGSGSGSASGNTVKYDDPERPDSEEPFFLGRRKQKTRKDPKIHYELTVKGEAANATEATDPDFLESGSDDLELELLFGGNLYVQQQTTGNRVKPRQRQTKQPKGLKSTKTTKKGIKKKPTDIAMIDRFHKAAATGNFQEVTMMIAEDIIDVSASITEKTTALHLAARNGELPVVRLLVQHNADINAEDIAGKTSLYWAAKENKLATVEYLLKMDAKRDIKTVSGWTPLHIAAYAGHDEILKLLLKHKFTVEARTSKGITPLFLAELKGHKICASELMEAGANPKLKNHSGGSPIQVAISKFNKPMLKDILFKLVPDLEDETYEEMMFCLGTESGEYQTSLLWLSVASGKDELVRLFLVLGVHIESLHEGYSILQTAAIHGHVSTTCFILEAGADTETVASDGSTALLLAAKFNRQQIVNLLLDNNANIEAKTMHTGRTALHVAVSLANVKLRGLTADEACDYTKEAKELVCILLKRGAYFGAKDKIGKTPLQLAQQVKDKLRAPTDVLLNPPAGKSTTFLIPYSLR